jgi:serine/threonine protein kinase
VAGSEYTDFHAQFSNEAKALMDIRDLKHPHIIQWLAAFTRGSEYYLMFPWADGGNLRDLWMEQRPQWVDLDKIRELVWEALQQFRGLANALVKLHMDKLYRHGDVKPENILRFRDEKTVTGILQIADFGLVKPQWPYNSSRANRNSPQHSPIPIA